MAAPPRQIAIVDVPFDGYGRRGHQAVAARVLRDAGLANVAGADMRGTPPIVLPPGSPERGPLTGLINEQALLALVPALHDRVRDAILAGAFPLVVGGDCSLLLGAVPGVCAVLSGAGLLFVDGHEDTTPLDVSEDGEAANTEIGLLLGITGRTPGFPLAPLLPALEPTRLAVVGTRDDAWRRAYNLGSVRERGVFTRTAAQTVIDPARTGVTAADHLGRGGPWWLHVDVDVLDPGIMPAAAVPGDDPEHDHGGLAWPQLAALLDASARRGGCVGMSVAVYDPCLDPRREYATRIVGLIHRTIAALDDGPRPGPGSPVSAR